ncbi:MAG TPA: EamA family transporter, partial [Patescibacteria group bacterium]|nr:EamA family transporter [Patescibacteria group bacterium]HLC88176.1 EamA family transporter [Patescibacteria group bacterium]
SRIDLFFYMPLIFLLPAVFIGLINYKKMAKIKKVLDIKDTLKLGLLALMFSVSATSTFAAYERGHNAAQIAILNQTSTLLIVFLGIIFLKERNHLFLKILGGVISLIGVFLVR